MWRSSAAVAAVAMIVACGETRPRPSASKTQPRAAQLTCSDSVYTASIRRGVTPKAFKAIEIGPAILNDLREARDPRLLQRTGSLLTYKSPLTIAASGEVTITVSSVHGGRIVLLYGTTVMDRLGPTAQIADFPVEERFRLCGYAGSALRVPQFAGGFGVSQPGCYRIEVSIAKRSTSHLVPFGPRSVCPSEI